MQRGDHEIASLHSKLLRQLQAQESRMKGVLERVSWLEADHAAVGGLSTEVAGLKEFQSVLNDEADTVRQQLREAKASADGAKDIGLLSRAVTEEAQFTFSICETVQGQVDGETMREKLN
jgi:hypothetical protein